MVGFYISIYGKEHVNLRGISTDWSLLEVVILIHSSILEGVSKVVYFLLSLFKNDCLNLSISSLVGGILIKQHT